jgi:hypothetical protein
LVAEVDALWNSGGGEKSFRPEVDALEDDGLGDWYVGEEYFGEVGKRALWVVPLDDPD